MIYYPSMCEARLDFSARRYQLSQKALKLFKVKQFFSVIVVGNMEKSISMSRIHFSYAVRRRSSKAYR